MDHRKTDEQNRRDAADYEDAWCEWSMETICTHNTTKHGSALSSFDEAGHPQHGVAQVAELARPARPRPQRERRRPLRPPPRDQHVRRHHRAASPAAVLVVVAAAAAPEGRRARGPRDVHRPRAAGAPRRPVGGSSRPNRRPAKPCGRRAAAGRCRCVVVVGRLGPQHLDLAELLGTSRHCRRALCRSLNSRGLWWTKGARAADGSGSAGGCVYI